MAMTFAAKFTCLHGGYTGLIAQPLLGQLQPAEPSHHCPWASSRPCSTTEAATERPTRSKEGNWGSALTGATALACPTQQSQLLPIQGANDLAIRHLADRCSTPQRPRLGFRALPGSPAQWSCVLFRLSDAEARRLLHGVRAFGEQLSSPFLQCWALVVTCCSAPCHTGHSHIPRAPRAPPAPWSCGLNAYRTWRGRKKLPGAQPGGCRARLCGHCLAPWQNTSN